MGNISDSVFFEVLTPIGFRVRTTSTYWQFIVTVKHPAMYGRQDDVADVLQNPDDIRQSLADPDVYLFYRMERRGRWLCVVAKNLAGEGFVITTYPVD